MPADKGKSVIGRWSQVSPAHLHQLTPPLVVGASIDSC